MNDFTFSIHTKHTFNKIKGNVFAYGIIRNNEYIYIGKTIKGLERFKDHKLIEDTDTIHIWIPNDEKYIGMLEARLINLFKPKYNTRHINKPKHLK